jgi:hypothetical protein
MDPHNQQAIVDEEERIGIKPVEPTFAPPTSAYAKYGKRDLDKTEEQIYKQQKMAVTGSSGNQEPMQATNAGPCRLDSQRPRSQS